MNEEAQDAVDAITYSAIQALSGGASMADIFKALAVAAVQANLFTSAERLRVIAEDWE